MMKSYKCLFFCKCETVEEKYERKLELCTKMERSLDNFVTKYTEQQKGKSVDLESLKGKNINVMIWIYNLRGGLDEWKNKDFEGANDAYLKLRKECAILRKKIPTIKADAIDAKFKPADTDQNAKCGI